MAIFMKVKGVEGSVTAAGFEQCIKINSLHHQFTQPIMSNDGYVVLMVCKRYLPQIKFPSEEKLKQEIENELYVELSERYISRLKRSSYIEIIN